MVAKNSATLINNEHDCETTAGAPLNSQGFNLIQNVGICTISGVTTGNITGQDPRLAPAPALERQADERSDEWVDRYRADAERKGLAFGRAARGRSA